MLPRKTPFVLFQNILVLKHTFVDLSHPLLWDAAGSKTNLTYKIGLACFLLLQNF